MRLGPATTNPQGEVAGSGEVGRVSGDVEPLTIIYQIDAKDRLVEFNAGWTDFARANQGEAAMPEVVAGTCLWDVVQDPTLQELYRRMVQKARGGEQVRFRYRCDAPQQRRVFIMEIRAAGGGRVEFASRLVAAEERASVDWLAHGVEHGVELVRMCSWCGRVALPDGAWVAIERAMDQHRSLHGATVPRLTHGICGECQAEMMQMLRRERAGDDLNRLPT